MKTKLILLILASLISACTYYQRDILDNHKEALNSYYNNNYEDAILQLKNLNSKDPLINEKIAYSYYRLDKSDSTLVWLKKISNTSDNIKYEIEFQSIIATKILNTFYREEMTFLHYILKRSIEINSDPSLVLSMLSILKNDSLIVVNKQTIDSLVTTLAQKIPDYKEKHKTYKLEPLLQEWIAVNDTLGFESDILKRFAKTYKKYRYKREKFYELESELVSDSLERFLELEGFTHHKEELYRSDSLKKIYSSNIPKSQLPNLALIAEAIGEYDIASEIYKNSEFHCNNQILKNAALFFIRRRDWNNTEKFLGALSLTEDNEFSERLRFYDKVLNNEIAKAEEILLDTQFSKVDSLNMSFLLNIAKDDFVSAATLAGKLEKDNSSLLAFALLLIPDIISEFYVSEMNPIDFTRDAQFNWPLENPRITSRYGWRPGPRYRNWNKRLRNMDFHYGLDMGGKVGTPVLATNRGVIVQADTLKISGKMVKIDHQNGYKSVYYHMNKIAVTKGDTVDALQKIGELGNTGRSFGAHLHFGIIDKNGNSVNPQKYLID